MCFAAAQFGHALEFVLQLQTGPPAPRRVVCPVRLFGDDAAGRQQAGVACQVTPFACRRPWRDVLKCIGYCPEQVWRQSGRYRRVPSSEYDRSPLLLQRVIPLPMRKNIDLVVGCGGILRQQRPSSSLFW